MWLYACCGLLCPAYPQHFVHGSVDKILEHWYAEQSCNFCGWQRYERGELVDVLWGELEWSSPTDDDELPEVTGPAWIVDKVAHYGG